MAENFNRLSPRQRMINLMYIVLTAMLALNVSSEVLDGFAQVQNGLARTNEAIAWRNDSIYALIQGFAEHNPAKGKAWALKAQSVREATDSIFKAIDSLKVAIVREADGKGGRVESIEHKEDLEAASIVMLSSSRSGERLREKINAYRDYLIAFVPDSSLRGKVDALLSAEGAMEEELSWEAALFDQKPAISAVALLTKLQNDVLYAEGEALASLFSNIEAKDLRVNALSPIVLPHSRIVMKGEKYEAQIGLAALDTTQRPQVFIGEEKIGNPQGLYSVVANQAGEVEYSGHILLSKGREMPLRYDFSSSYTVIEPQAAVSAAMMNVLYCGVDNPVDISVAGIPMSAVVATMTNGELMRKGDGWIARPKREGVKAVVTVSAERDGGMVKIAEREFRVRRLPNPAPYITISANGHAERYKGSKPIPKASLLAAKGLSAAIDDGLLDTNFQVLSFQTVFFDAMDNAMPENSNGAAFSQRQYQQMQRMGRGKRFFISSIKAKGPDGIIRDLSPMEVIIN